MHALHAMPDVRFAATPDVRPGSRTSQGGSSVGSPLTTTPSEFSVVVVAPPTLRLPTLRQRMDVRQEKSGFLNLPHIRLKTALRTLAAHAAAARDLAKREARARRVLQRWQRRQLQAASCSWVHATQAGARRAAAAQRVVAGRRRRGWRRLASHYTARRHVFLRRHGGTVVAMTHWGRRAIRRALLTWVHRGVDRISYAVVLARSVRRWEAAAAAHGWRAWQLFRHLEAAWRLREAHTRGVLHRTLSLLAWRRAARRRAEARARATRARAHAAEAAQRLALHAFECAVAAAAELRALLRIAQRHEPAQANRLALQLSLIHI